MAQIVALARTQKMVKTLISEVIAESTILGYMMQPYEGPESWEASAK